ncbi:MarR family transcriptional regulator [Clostridium sp.]|uniref:MarR family winged helix-turn-helix transcriptional regulator n=1 Tax=Clostridium sp. TaxID=1506 RepID=UPI002636979C|nr:MarR family transcriptional regulator [Clostridium sp.]
MDKYEVIKLDNQLCFSFYAISREIIKLYKPILDKFNLTYTQYITMLVLWEEYEINFKRLGERLHLDSGTLTPVVKKLEGMDLVSKYRTKEDDRVVVVKLTEKGKDLKRDIIEVPKELSCKIDIKQNQYLELKKSLDGVLEKLS